MLYHVSVKRNRGGIVQRGLLTSKSQGKLDAVWVVDEGRIAWAIAHVQKRHKVSLKTVDIWRILDDGSLQLRKCGREGLLYTRADVPTGNLMLWRTAEQWLDEQGDAEDEILNTEWAEQQANGARG